VVSSTVAFQRATAHVLQVELPTASTMASNPDPALGKENWKTGLDTAMGEGARSLDLLAATWKVHWLWEILPTASWVTGYSENPVTQQKSNHV
jgi:hypothetical protein